MKASAGLVLGSFALLSLLPLAGYAETATTPNMVFILADDLTYRDIGCYGSPNVKTPHIDQLAAEGTRFTQAFQATAMCSPTRHNLYTGLYPVKSGAYPQATWVYPNVQSIAHYLRPLGYRVALTGKRHVLPLEAFPFDYLDEDTDPDLAAVEAYLAESPDQPSCVFLCFREPHTPWTKGDPEAYDPDTIQLPPNIVDTPETRRRLTEYYAEISHLDGSVGRITEMLDRLGIADNTLVIFASEQGSVFPFAKWTCYDDGLQSAFIARWPGEVPSGRATNAMIEYVDVVPTLIDLAGGTPPDTLDGRSFLPALRGETDQHKEVVFGIQTTRGITNGSKYYGIRSVRSQRYRYILNLTPEMTFENNVTNQKGSWSSFWPTWVQAGRDKQQAANLVTRYQHRPEEELYDAQGDPFALNNLANAPSLRPIKEQLRRQLLDWMASQGDRGQITELEADERCLKSDAGHGAFKNRE